MGKELSDHVVAMPRRMGTGLRPPSSPHPLLTHTGAIIARDAAALMLFTLVAMLLMYPVVRNMGAHVIGWRGDQVAYIYMAGRVAQALQSFQSPFFDPNLDLMLLSTEAPYLQLLAVTPITWFAGPVFSYNLLILLSHLFSGYFVYLWIRNLTGSRAGGVVAGLAFMLAPFRIPRSYGHLTLVATQVLPLFFWALDRALETSRRRDLLLLSGAVVLVAGTSQYNLMICLVTGAVYALFTLARRPALLLSTGWKVAACVIAGALLGALPALEVVRQGALSTYNPAETRVFSADPTRFITPSPLHPLWGALVRQLKLDWLWVEQTLYLGLFSMLLALGGLFWRGSPQRGRSLVWLGTALFAAMLSIGTDIHLRDQPLQPEQPFWLPAYYLGQLPGLSFMRVWSRFGIITVLFVALLAGLGMARLVRIPRLHYWAPALAVLLISFDFAAYPLRSVEISPRPIDYWLAQQPGNFTVAFLPVLDGLPSYQIAYGSLIHGKRTFAALHDHHHAATFADFASRARSFPSPESVLVLRELNLRYLILERQFYDGKRAPAWESIKPQLEAIPELEIVAEVGDALVLRFRE